MSHRIIISSIASPSAHEITKHADHGAAIDVNIAYTPSHDESDAVVLKRVGKLLKLMRKMEEAATLSGDDPELSAP